MHGNPSSNHYELSKPCDRSSLPCVISNYGQKLSRTGLTKCDEDEHGQQIRLTIGQHNYLLLVQLLPSRIGNVGPLENQHVSDYIKE